MSSSPCLCTSISLGIVPAVQFSDIPPQYETQLLHVLSSEPLPCPGCAPPPAPLKLLQHTSVHHRGGGTGKGDSKQELHCFHHMCMWTKLRPGIWHFLERVGHLPFVCRDRGLIDGVPNAADCTVVSAMHAIKGGWHYHRLCPSSTAMRAFHSRVRAGCSAV